jgi:ubiquinone/menaquinone biosynthesis C-methylase UbiE
VADPTSDKVARAYSSPDWWYDLRGFCILHLTYRDGLIRLLNFFAGNGSLHHLEVAAGSGSFLQLVMQLRKLRGLPPIQGTAIDYAPSMLAGAVRRFQRKQGWKVELADATRLPYANESFETVNVANALHSIPNAAQAVKEAFRVLRPGGTLAVNMILPPRGGTLSRSIAGRVNAWGMRKGILVRPYEEEETRDMFLTAGFQILQTQIRGNNYCLLLKKP